jgi:choline kinase
MRNNRFTTFAKKIGNPLTDKNLLSVIIPAAGMGHRMKSYGPKCLLHADKKYTIVERIIYNVYKVYPDSDIITVVGFDADKVIKILPRDIRIVENQFYEDTNVVESLRLALNNAAYDNVLIIYGDLIFNPETILDLTGSESRAIIDTKGRFKNEEIGVTIVDGKITNFAYGLNAKWAQIIYLTGQELEFFKELCFDRKRCKMYPFELLNMVINRGGSIGVVEPDGMEIKEVDSLRDLT